MIMAMAGMVRAMGPLRVAAGAACDSVNTVKVFSFVLFRRVQRPPQYLIAQTNKRGKVTELQSSKVKNTLQLCNLATLQLLICYRLDGLPGSLPPAKAGDYNNGRSLWALVFA